MSKPLKSREVAKELSVCEETVRRCMRLGLLRATRYSFGWRVERADLDEYKRARGYCPADEMEQLREALYGRR